MIFVTRNIWLPCAFGGQLERTGTCYRVRGTSARLDNRMDGALRHVRQMKLLQLCSTSPIEFEGAFLARRASQLELVRISRKGSQEAEHETRKPIKTNTHRTASEQAGQLSSVRHGKGSAQPFLGGPGCILLA